MATVNKHLVELAHWVPNRDSPQDIEQAIAIIGWIDSVGQTVFGCGIPLKRILRRSSLNLRVTRMCIAEDFAGSGVFVARQACSQRRASALMSSTLAN